MITVDKNSNDDFRILNLTDTQLTAEEWEKDNQTGKIFRETAQTLIKRISPDLITLSGDLSYAGDYESYKNFADYFDSFSIPWTVTFGNHDNQDGDESVQKVLNEYKKHKFFVFEDCQRTLGNTNFTILIKLSGKSAEGVILMDTHDRVRYKSADGSERDEWAKLTPIQLDWYKEQIEELEKAGCNESVLITHIPINAYGEAFKEAFKSEINSKSVSLEESIKGDVWNDGYKDSCGVDHEPISCYPDDEGAFDLILKLGSTKNVLCGHNHINNWIINYKGVRLAFALKTGRGSYWEPVLNGGTVITVGKNGVKSLCHEYVDVSALL